MANLGRNVQRATALCGSIALLKNQLRLVNTSSKMHAILIKMHLRAKVRYEVPLKYLDNKY
jgi:hypothetical protein